MKEVGPSLSQIRWFDAASKGEIVNWDEVFEHFEAAVDWPAAAYYQELSEYYPEAKIILSIRDAEGWYNSTKTTIYAFFQNVPTWMRWVIPPLNRLLNMVQRTVWDGVLAGEFENRTRTIERFNSHIEAVKKTIPAERLLIHSAAEGWQPICTFLGKPLPTTPYPRVNETKDFQRMFIVMRILRWLPWVLGAGLAYYFIAT
jgi:hypothetical protein